MRDQEFRPPQQPQAAKTKLKILRLRSGRQGACWDPGRAALDQHWAASDANDCETEHRIYPHPSNKFEVLGTPIARTRCWNTRSQASAPAVEGTYRNQRASQPSKKRLAVRRIMGSRDLWITELILTYDDKPSYTVSPIEFRDSTVTRETQCFADPFVAPASRAQWVERMDT